ncbi:hypothetical protein HMPREF1230_1784 [Streptococcus pyogenes GA19681]|nr:Hypothetical cytosolic protein [Streptococcus pyogenes MGAS10394]AIQ00895.1 hypothetical protein FE90_0126 [Streptococcus pyogenes]EQL77830.1 hypothetical protein HMPREF1230_1784 [Streptococcus pyogenes GA19681]ESA44668.1 hypothetical protein HMPREF1233_1622 [Streptococcus pyogenes GA19700]ESA47097.1 hypothetical protein HMPREF1234_1817 [Streptococcus pyogenes GA41039]ESA50222.1 hypothetical protein HMPREF1232_1921 [Streptococcus pyogenes GA40468]ESA50549.1 hypothetical protein HMPREF1235_
MEFHALFLPQQKAAVLAHVTRKNKKSAEQFKFFEHQTGIVYILKSP